MKNKINVLALVFITSLLSGCDYISDLLNSIYENNTVETSCGGTLRVYSESNEYGIAAASVKQRYPNFAAGQAATNPRFVDAHQTGNPFNPHAELAGFGVTMIQIEDGLNLIPVPVENASGVLNEPSLLFFEKGDVADQENWNIIGMGYTFDFDPDVHPTLLAETNLRFDVHEAGYHHTPGDGGFTCATDDNLTAAARDNGLSIDDDACIGISDDDLSLSLNGLVRHGRYWTVHLWFEPNTNRLVRANTDPWCRQAANAVAVTCDAFKTQRSCE